MAGPRATPFIQAIEVGCEAEVMRMLAEGADPNEADGDGWPAVVIAAAEGHNGILQALAEAGADLGELHRPPTRTPDRTIRDGTCRASLTKKETRR